MDNTRAHQDLVRRILRESSNHPHVFLHPNVVGEGYNGAIAGQLFGLAKRGPDALHAGYAAILHRNRVAYGMGTGSPDLAGWVRPRGERFARVIVGEVKTGRGDLSESQLKWHEAERERLGVVPVWRDVGDFLATIEEVGGG